MGSIYLMFAAFDHDLADQIKEELRKSGLQIAIDTFVLDERAIGDVPDERVLTDAGSSECVILIWSQAMQQATRAPLAIHAAIQAWARDAIVIGRPDRTELPSGLRDLASQPLKAKMVFESIRMGADRADDGEVQFLVALVHSRLNEAEARRVQMSAPPLSELELKLKVYKRVNGSIRKQASAGRYY